MSKVNKTMLTAAIAGILAAPASSQEAYFDNDNSALVPELWAMEGLMILQKLCIMPWLVYRDFDGMVANFGETVNAYLPNTFNLTRKTDADDVTTQDASSTSVPVKLDQHLVVSFVIKDGEESKSFKDLITLYLEPAMVTIAEGVDKILAGQVYQFIENSIGGAGVSATATSLSKMKAKMTNNRVPVTGRNNVLSADTEAELTALDLFVGAQNVGDDGTALREGSLGRKYGANNITDIAIPSLTGGTAGLAKTVDHVAGYPKGYEGAITLDTGTAHAASAVVELGGFIYTVSASALTSVTFNEPLQAAVADGATINQLAAGAFTTARSAGYSKATGITGIRGVVGEGIRTAAGHIYTIIDVPSAGQYLLDRPLEADLGAGAVLGVFPDADYNFCFHSNALALVSRPLALPKAGVGALSAVVDDNGIGVRVVITYDGKAQGHRVTLDLLAGVKVLNKKLGAVLLS